MDNLAITTETVEQVLLNGDLSKLTTEQRLSYYQAVTKSLGLNPLTKPFDFIALNGKLVLYAKRDCTDQLRSLKNISIIISARETIGDIYIVTAKATTPEGRCDESTGAVNLKGISGDNLANLYMKAETKAKRRATLSISGLGFLDETEVESGSPAEAILSTKAEPSISPSIPVKKHTIKELQDFVMANFHAIGWTNEDLWNEIAKLQPEADRLDKVTEETLVALIKCMKALYESQNSAKPTVELQWHRGWVRKDPS
jgi:hypothetical protein